MNKRLIGLLCLIFIFTGCGKVEEGAKTSTLTLTGKIINGATGTGPRAKSMENISDTVFKSISSAVQGLAGIKLARVDEDGNFSIQLSIAKASGLNVFSPATQEVDLIFARNGYNTTKESFTYTGTEETINLGLITIEADAQSASPEAVPTTAGKVSLLKQTRDPNISYGDDTGRIGPDPNDIYSARQINTDVNIKTNQWYTLRAIVASTEGAARIKIYLDGVLVKDEIDSASYGQAYYSDLRNGNFAIEADAGGQMAYLAIDDVMVSKEGTTFFTDDFESGFNSSSQEGKATWWAMNGSWEVTAEAAGNHYLRGETETTRYQAFLFYPSYSNKSLYLSWVNYSVQFRFKILDSRSSLHFRLRHRFNDDPALTGSTYIGNTCYMLVVEP